MVWRREYVPRLRTGELKWQPGAGLGPLACGTEVKILSTDARDGASTCLWRLPAGWSIEKPFALSAALSLYVLEGDIAIGKRGLSVDGYAHHEAGMRHGALRTSGGATLLAMWDGPAVPERPARTMEGQPIFLDTNSMAPVPTFVDGPVSGITVKLLRRDSKSGGMTLLVTIPAGWHEPRAEHHDCVEESFKLAGDIGIVENGHSHVLEAGDYFFRPPRIKHGPMTSRTGTTSLIRFSAAVVNHYGPVEDLPA